ncbi:MAG: phosphate ABC transporter permease subunit PstC [Cyanobacteria bacterium J06638_28]
MTAKTPVNDSRALWKPNYQNAKTMERVVRSICGLFAAISIATTVGILLTLTVETGRFFNEISFWHFITATKWKPLFSDPEYGILVPISGTLLTSCIAILTAVPLGLLSAIFLSEFAATGVRRVLKPMLEILAGVPSVVFGYFALLTVTPVLQFIFEFLSTPITIPASLEFLPFTFAVESDLYWQLPLPYLGIFNALSAGMVLGISITPLIASLSEDAIYSVPQSLRNGAYALGATKRETVVAVVLPAALSGVVASIILAVSRAVGETMIVTLAAGQNPILGFNPFGQVMTMTAYIVQVATGDVAFDTLRYRTIFAVGTTLFSITLCLNIFSFWFVRRFRERYE